MPDSFDAYEYADYVKARWKQVAVTCTAAVLLAAVGSAILPHKYTATSRIFVEAPAGADPRSAMAVSPIYLESLRTYEHFASSDSLFLRAIDRFQLRDGRPIESVKKSVLSVALARNTRILEISATLRDAKKAHALALYLAEETVNLNRAIHREGEIENTTEADRQFREARQRLEEAEAAWIAAPDARKQELTRSRRVAQDETDSASRRLQESRAAVGFRGERLKIIDPGVVPERPSSPNLALNVAAALALSLVLSIGWLTISFGAASRPRARERSQLRAVSRDA